jgi:S-adenosyl methyltransferase
LASAAGSTSAAGAAAAGEAARRLGLALFLVSAAQFVLQLDFSIVNVALATIQREPGVVRVSEWRPESHEDAHAHTTLWGGVGRKR